MQERTSVDANSSRGSSGLPHTHDLGKNYFRFCSAIVIAAREGHHDDKYSSIHHHCRRKPVKRRLPVGYRIEFGRKLRES